jgi:hypothetical protein
MLAQNVEFFMGQESFVSYAAFKSACDALKHTKGVFQNIRTATVSMMSHLEVLSIHMIIVGILKWWTA